jgi:hypothetical protein
MCEPAPTSEPAPAPASESASTYGNGSNTINDDDDGIVSRLNVPPPSFCTRFTLPSAYARLESELESESESESESDLLPESAALATYFTYCFFFALGGMEGR